MLDGLLSIALAFFVVTVSPGPANLAVSTVAVRFGRRRGLLFGAGLSLGLAVWGVVAASGLGAILQTSATMLTVLKVVGGVYLLWLAVQSGRSAVRGASAAEVCVGEGRWFVRGLVLNLSNPKAVVAWMAALSMGMGSDSAGAQVMVATALCCALGLANYTLYALTFSVGRLMRVYKRVHRWVEGVVAGLFALAGFGLLRSALSR